MKNTLFAMGIILIVTGFFILIPIGMIPIGIFAGIFIATGAFLTGLYFGTGKPIPNFARKKCEYIAISKPADDKRILAEKIYIENEDFVLRSTRLHHVGYGLTLGDTFKWDGVKFIWINPSR